ncbi:MAG: phosphoribosylformylglycinamidine cyclo-ligase [Candidatus Omnitrophica bacterium]|nr:phosphoribosylformylglycinamidine cyclo-ligase [Candidatus Omnitrophota bacterium]MBU4472668.1 phosphoribosylformylglycinamidine cyclo-ligase [Candidatus Omnitrophota bacterium]MCG2706707.1 phosphoribosylformylglycinamidine cyclo-ligase [Candidatus Omnitrophota bacterium]
MRKLTYKKSGVDIQKAGIFKSKIRTVVRKSFSKGVLKDIGGFGSFFRFPKEKYRDPILVSSSDGVGTKLKIAVLANKHDTVGIDAVAMNVNDILCVGAKMLFFLDYIAFSKLEEDVLIDVVKGINNGCIEADCSLIGGETAQMPGMYKDGDYDVAGFCVGVAERKNIIDGSKIEAGDMVIGLESNGVHSNGYSLVRKVFSGNELRRMSNELLKPTRIYVKPILSLLNASARGGSALGGKRYTLNAIKGIAHITGGAFYDKIARILPKDVNVRIDKSAWQVPKIFRLIQNKGGIEDKEMYHTFNMGVGMVLIVEPNSVKAVISKLAGFKLRSWVIGRVVKGRKEVEII